MNTLAANQEICPTASGAALQPSLWTWANIYKVSASIFALHEIGVLRLLCSEALPCEEIAFRLDLSQELLEPLLHLLVSVGVIEEHEHSFQAARGVESVLPLLTMEAKVSTSYLTAAQIAHTVRTGEGTSFFETANTQEYLPVFTSAMRTNARALAPRLVRLANLRQRRRILDLGGADGSLAVALQTLNPELSITVVDLPRMRTPFESYTVNAPDSSSLDFYDGDLREPEFLIPLLAQVDVILLSNVLHLLSTATRLSLYQTIRQHGTPRTQFLIYDQFPAENGSLDSARLLTVDWVVNGIHFRETAQELGKILEDLGFSNPYFRQFVGLPGAIVGTSL